jgi:hypothetical protein
VSDRQNIPTVADNFSHHICHPPRNFNKTNNLLVRSFHTPDSRRSATHSTRMLHDSVRNRQINRFEAGLTMAMF